MTTDNNTKWRLWMSVGVVVLMVAGCSIVSGQENATATTDKSMIDLTVNWEKATNGLYVLKMTLANRGQETLTMQRNDLPWENWYSILLVASVAETPALCDPLKREIVECGLMVGDIKLEAGKSLSGEIILNHRFWDFDKVIRKDALIVFWSYQLKTWPRNDLKQKHFAGWILIPAESNAKPRNLSAP